MEIAAKENKKVQQQLEQQLSTQQIEMHNQKEMIQELQKKEEEQERRKNIRKNWCKLILKVVIRNYSYCVNIRRNILALQENEIGLRDGYIYCYRHSWIDSFGDYYNKK